MRNRFLLLLTLCIPFAVFSQDSSTTAVFNWTVKANKLSDKKYELFFSSTGGAGTQLYAPSQDLDGTASVELVFNDSSILLESFIATGDTKKITSSIFNNKQFIVTEGKRQIR